MKLSKQPLNNYRSSLEKWGRFACLLITAAFLGSCSSYHHISKNEKQEITLASKKLKVSITKKDNRPLLLEAASWLGVPYRYGGSTKAGTDCSGLSYQIFRKIYRVQLAHNSQQQYKEAPRKIRKSKLKQGDLVFFSPKKSKRKINHVGIYLKDGKFIHASSSKGVRLDFLGDPYWEDIWVSAGRYH